MLKILEVKMNKYQYKIIIIMTIKKVEAIIKIKKKISLIIIILITQI